MTKLTDCFQSTLKIGEFTYKFELCCAYRNVIALIINWFIFCHHTENKIIVVLQN